MGDDETRVVLALQELCGVTKWAESRMSERTLGAFRCGFAAVEENSRKLKPLLEFWDAADPGQAPATWRRAVHDLAPADAKEMSARLLAISARLTSVFREVAVEWSDERTFAVRGVLGHIYTDLLRPLWAAFPELMPQEMKT